MKTLAILLATCVAVLAQILILEINGLTILTIPTTIFLGFEVMEKLTEPKEEETI